MRSSMVQVNELSFHVRHAGDPDAPMILFLHGFPEYSGAWDEMLERLSDRYFCVAPDQRGYNLSACPLDTGAYSTGKLTGDMLGILDQFRPGGQVAAVVGHDWGAAVAYGLSFRAPERMRCLVILNGVHPIPFQRALAAGGPQAAASQYILWLRREGSEDALAQNDFERLRGFFAKGMDMDWLAGPRLEAYLGAWRAPGTLRGMVNWYRASPLQVAAPGAPLDPALMPKLPQDSLRVRVPHLLIWGENDRALLPEAYEGLGEHCEDLLIERVAGADHWIAHQKPDLVAEMIADAAERATPLEPPLTP